MTNNRIQHIESKISSIQHRLNQAPSHLKDKGQEFGSFMESKLDSIESKVHKKMGITHAPPLQNFQQIQGVGSLPLFSKRAAEKVKPLAQSNSVSCGQTSVAMAVNSLTGKNLSDQDIDASYGFQLLDALNAESREAGYQWQDLGNLNSQSWKTIDRQVNQEGRPVIVALNGPEFSPSGRGHIVTIVKTEGDTVTYADPANGQIKTTSKKNMQEAPSHPQGNFIFASSPANPYNNSHFSV